MEPRYKLQLQSTNKKKLNMDNEKEIAHQHSGNENKSQLNHNSSKEEENIVMNNAVIQNPEHMFSSDIVKATKPKDMHMIGKYGYNVYKPTEEEYDDLDSDITQGEYEEFLSHTQILKLSLLTDIPKTNWPTKYPQYTNSAQFSRILGFSEYIYGFLDVNSLSCIIADSHNPKLFGNAYFDNDKFSFKVYANCENTIVNLGHRTKTFHREYICVIREKAERGFGCFAGSFYECFNQYFFERLVVQHKLTQSQYLLDILKYGHQFLPCFSMLSPNFNCGYINIQRNSYGEIASQYIGNHIEDERAVELFVTVFCEYVSQQIRQRLWQIKSIIIDKSQLGCDIANIITVMMEPRSTLKDPIGAQLSDGCDLFLLRAAEMEHLKHKGYFLLNPFKYPFLHEYETKKLQEMILMKHPIDTNFENRVTKWVNIDGFNYAMSQLLYCTMCKGGMLNGEEEILLTPQEILQCIDI